MALLAGLALCYLAATHSLATMLSSRSAQTALRIAPWDARALAGSAYVLLQADQSEGALATVRERASEALLREPANILALRTLGLAASMDGNDAGARDFFMQASRLSKRDLPSQLWWIEQEVAEGDITGALTYYDQALRTSRRAANTLMPVLVEASAEPLVAERLSPFLERRPAYLRQFFIQATDTATDVSGAAALGAQVLDRADPDDQDLINRIILRLGRDEDFDPAWSMFAWAHGGLEDASIINGSFDQPTPFRLFHWELTPDDALTAEVAPRGSTDSLYLVARVSRGLAARQLLRLQPGSYRLSALVGDVPDAAIDRPAVGITCARGSGTVLEQTTFPAAPAGQAGLQASFTVPAGCRYQWLDLTASATTQDEVRSWIDDIVIRPNPR